MRPTSPDTVPRFARRPAGRALAAAAGVTALAAAGLTAVSVSATAATSPCTVSYSVVNSWPGGFQAGITITNNGSAITGWTLAFAFPGSQQVSSGWNGTFTQSGQNVTVTDAGYNGALATGAGTSIGFTGTYTGTNTDPTAFTLNGASCNGSGGGPSPSASSSSPTPTPTPSPSSSPSASPSKSASASPSASPSSSPTQPGQPSVPGTCQALSANLATGNELFSSSAESSPPDTSRLQSALNSCAGSGKAVELKANGGNAAFLSGPLSIGGNEVLLVDSGVTLYASRNPANYQISGKNTCGTIASSDNGCNPFITLSGSGAGIMGTRSSSGSQGTIDGRGGQDMLNTSETWWQLATAAKSGGSQNNPKLIQSNGASSLTLYDINLINSPMYHALFKGGSNITVWGIRIKTPSNSRNTDGVDPENTTNVLVNDSYIQDGDDCIAVKSDAGSLTSQITVQNTHCWGTHGLSIGSQTAGGVSNVTFLNDTLAGTDTGGITSTSNNGIRVKSDSSVGGTVSGVTYQNICMTGVKDLIVMDPNYSSGNGSAIPNFASITLNGVVSVNSASSAKSILDGYDSSHKLGLKLENVRLDATGTSAQYANIGLYNSNITASGTGVTVSNISGSGSVPSCSFPGYPAL
ncbi:cellulose binding domain-containing protein [Actinocrinis puniceicyclus]|uniref:Cellulose binding domain-containing protein n=1 Tax=Actinocrinis puniceicyclus TaxID=977794 RepID=A0A8J7WSJ9_9ACTN|nr:glycosyl hydrolase family 28 protein [Actinocrinis puniceicyclus]MBS2965682.1 cellulose binding domain-containing protein [Actinocrinis puniceicyclus]